MTGWLAPVLAGAFWSGILAWPALRPVLAIWVLLTAGVLGLGVAAWLAPARASEIPLARAGLLDPASSPALEAVASPRTASARGPPGAVVLSLVAATTLFGAGWAGLHDLRVRSGLLARIAPREVSVEGTLATDPEPGAGRWSSIMQVGVVGLYDATSRSTTERSTSETVWLEGFGTAPRVRRGDRVRVEGSAEPPYRGPFAVSLQRRGIMVVLSARELIRVGASTNPLVRATQGVRAMLLAHLMRLFPPRQAGLLMGLALGDTSRLDPADEEHFRATGLGHLLAVSGENDRHVTTSP